MRDIADTEATIQENQFTSELTQSKLDDIRDSRVHLGKMHDSSIEDTMLRYIASKIQQNTSKYQEKLSNLESQLRYLPTQHQSSMDELQDEQDVTGMETGITEVSAAFQLYKDIKPRCENLLPEEIYTEIQSSFESKESYKLPDVKRLRQDVENLLEILPVEKQIPLIEKIIKAMIFDSKVLKTYPIARIGLYSAYIATLVFGVVVIPQLILIYCGMMLVSVVQNLNQSKVLIEMLSPLQELSVAASSLKKRIIDEVAHRKAEKLTKTKICFDTDTSAIEHDILETRRTIQQLEFDIRTNTPEDEAVAGVKQKFEEDMRRLDEAEAETELEINDSNLKNDSLLEKSAQLQNKLAALKQSMTEAYMSLSSAGTSQLIPKSFFLGFNQDDGIIEFVYDGDATVVLYSGSESTTTTSLITMMIIQLLSMVNPAQLNISVVDLWAGGSDFALFMNKDLEEIFKIVTTKQELDALISDVHSDMTMRNKMILTVADNIELYNMKMMEHHSLTIDYRFIFLQFADLSVLCDDKLMQACKSGPRVGIIPIIYLSKEMISNAYREGSESDLKAVIKILESVRYEYFDFSGEQSFLYKYEVEFRDVQLQRLKDRLKNSN